MGASHDGHAVRAVWSIVQPPRAVLVHIVAADLRSPWIGVGIVIIAVNGTVESVIVGVAVGAAEASESDAEREQAMNGMKQLTL